MVLLCVRFGQRTKKVLIRARVIGRSRKPTSDRRIILCVGGIGAFSGKRGMWRPRPRQKCCRFTLICKIAFQTLSKCRARSSMFVQSEVDVKSVETRATRRARRTRHKKKAQKKTCAHVALRRAI